jgi:hypothetical protein
MKKILVTVAITALLCLGLVEASRVHKPSQSVFAQSYALCYSVASPAVCQSGAQGIGNIAAAAQTEVVDTTAVTAGARIFLTPDASTVTGTLLGVTCNTTIQPLYVSAQVVGQSFTVKALTGTYTTNPGCFHWQIVTP